MAVLRAKELTKIYQAGKVSVRALNGISLSVGKGSFTAVIGKSGSGKTTLLNVLSGLEMPDSGTVYLGAAELTGLKDKKMAALRRKKTGFVFQKFYLIPEFTVWENILIPFYLDDKKPRDRICGISFERDAYVAAKRFFPEGNCQEENSRERRSCVHLQTGRRLYLRMSRPEISM